MHFGLGYLHWKSQQYDEARQEFERELALDPNHAQALAYLGDIEWKNNDPDAAFPLLKRAMRAQKTCVSPMSIWALSTCSKKNYKDAEAALLRAVALDPALPDAHYQLGRLYQVLGKTADAERNFTKCRNCTRRMRRAWPERCLPLRRP